MKYFSSSLAAAFVAASLAVEVTALPQRGQDSQQAPDVSAEVISQPTGGVVLGGNIRAGGEVAQEAQGAQLPGQVGGEGLIPLQSVEVNPNADVDPNTLIPLGGTLQQTATETKALTESEVLVTSTDALAVETSPVVVEESTTPPTPLLGTETSAADAIETETSAAVETELTSLPSISTEVADPLTSSALELTSSSTDVPPNQGVVLVSLPSTTAAAVATSPGAALPQTSTAAADIGFANGTAAAGGASPLTTLAPLGTGGGAGAGAGLASSSPLLANGTLPTTAAEGVELDNPAVTQVLGSDSGSDTLLPLPGQEGATTATGSLKPLSSVTPGSGSGATASLEPLPGQVGATDTASAGGAEESTLLTMTGTGAGATGETGSVATATLNDPVAASDGADAAATGDGTSGAVEGLAVARAALVGVVGLMGWVAL